jgi:hypothetical protein
MRNNLLSSKVSIRGLMMMLLCCLFGLSLTTTLAQDSNDYRNTLIDNNDKNASLVQTNPILFEKGNISIEIHMNNGILEERYLVRQDNNWIEMATSKGESIGSVSMIDSSNQSLPGSVIDIRQDDASITEEFAIGNYRVTRKLTVIDEGPWVRVTTQLTGGESASIHAFYDQFCFSNEPDWSYAPSIGGFIPDAYYKAPVIMCQSNSTAFAIVPDLSQLREDVLKRCKHFLGLNLPAGRLLSVGFVPPALVAHSVYAPDQMGPVALFLLQLYKQDGQQQYLDAAEMGLSFIEKSVIPSREWYDYETFWSCAPKSTPFDEITGQNHANNLALSQTVAAFLLAWQVTGDSHYLSTGEALLDYLLLYQQCWTHPLIGGLESKTALLGGFTTQNSDAEWSDARQSQIGNILLDYYRATGKIEYLERGITALRAQFPISPYENVAHTGYGSKNVTRDQVGHLHAIPPWYTYNRYPEK